MKNMNGKFNEICSIDINDLNLSDELSLFLQMKDIYCVGDIIDKDKEKLIMVDEWWKELLNALYKINIAHNGKDWVKADSMIDPLDDDLNMG